jgi:hypothetical protein
VRSGANWNGDQPPKHSATNTAAKASARGEFTRQQLRPRSDEMPNVLVQRSRAF